MQQVPQLGNANHAMVALELLYLAGVGKLMSERCIKFEVIHVNSRNVPSKNYQEKSKIRIITGYDKNVQES